MGTTPKYRLPWPAPADKLRDGANAIRLLAESVEQALLPPLLSTAGDGDLSWSDAVAEVPWDVTDSPARKRGDWTSAGAAERLVIPGTPGWFLVTASIRFAGAGDTTSIEASLRTRAQGTDAGSGEVWATQRVANPGSGSTTNLVVTSVVRVDDTAPRTGIAVRLAYSGVGWGSTGGGGGGGSNPPNTGTGANRLRIHWLSAL